MPNLNLGVQILNLLLIVTFLILTSKVLADAQSAAAGQNLNQSNLTITNKKIVINLSSESLVAYQADSIFLQTPITAGGPQTPTPIGTYQVQSKLQNFIMRSPWPTTDWRWYPDSYVHYALGFAGSGYFIHDAGWRSNFGYGSNSVAGIPGGSFTGTHGCINVPLFAVSSLYNWANLGTLVIIQP